jgi:hypothetical protein
MTIREGFIFFFLTIVLAGYVLLALLVFARALSALVSRRRAAGRESSRGLQCDLWSCRNESRESGNHFHQAQYGFHNDARHVDERRRNGAIARGIGARTVTGVTVEAQERRGRR